jgi:hypothetical protein
MAKSTHKKQVVVAHHEAGHAVTAVFNFVPFRYVTIIRDEGSSEEDASLGHVLIAKCPKWFTPGEAITDRTFVFARRLITINFAGQLAEVRLRGRRSRQGAKSDNLSAINTAFCLCGSKKTAEAFMHYCWCLVSDMIADRWALSRRRGVILDECHAIHIAVTDFRKRSSPSACGCTLTSP